MRVLARAGSAPAATASLPGRMPPSSAGSRPARRTEDLPLPGRADDREQRRADQPRDELGHEPLAPEEVVRVLGPERREPLERAHDRAVRLDRRRRALARPLQVDDALDDLGLHRAQPARPSAACSAATVTRSAASRRAHSPAASWTALGTPRLASSSARDRDGASAAGRARSARAIASTAAASSGSSSISSARVAVEPRRASSPSASSEHRQAVHGAGQALELRPLVRAGPVGVVDDHERRPGRLARVAQDAPGAPRGARRPPRTARGRRAAWTRAASSAASRLLPIPRAPVTVTSAPRPAAGALPACAQGASSSSRPANGVSPAVSSAAGSSAGTRARATGPGAGSRRGGPGAAARARCPPPSTSALPRLAVDLERLGLALAAVEGEHQLPGQPLTVAVRGRRGAAARPRARRGGRRRGPPPRAARARSAAAPRAA